MKPSSKALLLGVAIAALIVVVFVRANYSTAGASEAHQSQTSSQPPPRKQLRLSYDFSPGWIGNHDLYVTNSSGEDLTEATLAITFVGEDGSPALERFWATWPLGVRHQVSIPVESVKNVQRIFVNGRAEEGDIAEGLGLQ